MVLLAVWLVIVSFGVGLVAKILWDKYQRTDRVFQRVTLQHNDSSPNNINEFEKLAQTRVSKVHWKFYSLGAGEELTLRDNVTAYNRYIIRPRYLNNVSDVDMSVTLFEDELDLPIGTCPTSFYSPACHGGEMDIARACSDVGACMILSDFSSVRMEDVSKVFYSKIPRYRGTIWYDLQTGGTEKVLQEHIRRAEASGFKALVLTIDHLESSKEKAVIVERFIDDVKFLNYGISDGKSYRKFNESNLVDLSVTWKRVDWIKSCTKLPIILKGIMTAEDAREAIRHNIQGIIVSNHGGRQLDGLPATIDVLGEVVSAVENKVDVFIDGGVRKGTDVFKALALGAKAVFIGRPAIWGMEYNGFEGVKSVFRILQDKLKLAMQLSGCANLLDIRKENVVVHESHYRGGCQGRH